MKGIFGWQSAGWVMQVNAVCLFMKAWRFAFACRTHSISAVLRGSVVADKAFFFVWERATSIRL